MQIFERPPRFRSIWCKNPHQIQAVKSVTHNYSAARNPVRQAKPSYSRRSLEHSLAHLSHWSKECNHSDISCSPSLLKVKCWEAASEWAENRMTQIQYFWEIKLSFASATAKTYCADEFCLVAQGLQPRETWVRRPNFGSCLCYCPTVWSWISHFTTPGNKVLLWGILLGNSLEISENKEETGRWYLQLSARSGRKWQRIAASSVQKWVVRVVRKEWCRNECCARHQGVEKGLMKWWLSHCSTHWACKGQVPGLPAGWTTKAYLMAKTLRMWLAFHALRVKSFTTSAVPHIQEPWIRASEVVSLTSTFQSF